MKQNCRMIVLGILLAAGTGAGEVIRCKDVADTWVSLVGREAEGNNGRSNRLKLKGTQEMTLIRFEVGALRGRRIRSARLFCHARGKDRLRKIGLSTVATRWIEGRGWSYTRDLRAFGATFRQASYKKRPWALPGGDVTDVVFGNGNTRQHHTQLRREKSGWWSVDVSPELVSALITGESDGWFLMDESGQTWANNFIHSRESGRYKPYLLVEVGASDRKPPSPPTRLSLRAFPSAAHIGQGAAQLTLTPPSDAFTYHLKVNGKVWPRWRTPRPTPGKKQSLVLEGLPPEKALVVAVRVSDAAGNISSSVIVRSRSSKGLAVPSPLPADAPALPAGDPPLRAGKLRVWAVPGSVNVDPIAGGKKYARSNALWSGVENRITLAGARGEFISFQLIFEAPKPLRHIRVTCPSKHFSTDRVWYVRTGNHWIGELALPLPPGSRFAIPDRHNKIPNQLRQSVWVDLLIPLGSKLPSVSFLSIEAEGVARFKIPISLEVYDFALPNELGFNVELNCYGPPGGRAGTRSFFAAHRLAHRHRTTLNCVPYGQAGYRVHRGFVPRLEGTGEKVRAASWSEFDRCLGPLLDGSAFEGLPRGPVPVPVMYLPLNESWPCRLDSYYRYDGPRRGKDIIAKHALRAGPIEQAFPQAYQAAFTAVAREFVRHAEQKKWTQTQFQCYLNNKYHYRQKGYGSSWWNLDEPQHYDDWQALRFYAKLFASARRTAKTTHFVFREDLSRPHLQFTWLDGLCRAMYIGGQFFPRARACRAMAKRMNAGIVAYGSAHKVGRPNVQNVGWPIQAYINGADGVLPWQSLGSPKAFDKPQQTALIVQTGTHPAVRSLLPRPYWVASLRLKALRRGQQDCEYLRILADRLDFNREQIRYLVGKRLVAGKARFRPRFTDEAAAVHFPALTPARLAAFRRAVAKYILKKR